MKIELDRWEAAQSAEFGHHEDLRREAYSTATNVIARYLGFNCGNDFRNNVIVQC